MTIFGPIDLLRRCLPALLLLLVGCAAFEPRTPRNALNDEPLRAALIDLLCRVEPSCQMVRVHVIERTYPQAEMFPDGSLLINIGMLTATRSEAEIAFVLTHEVAHRRLRHLPAKSAEERTRLELEADAFAVERLRASGMQPAAGYQLLVRLLIISRAEARRDELTRGEGGAPDSDVAIAAAAAKERMREGLAQLDQRIRALRSAVSIEIDTAPNAADEAWRQRLTPYREGNGSN